MPWMNFEYFQSRPEAERTRLLATHLLLGSNPTTGDSFLVPTRDRYAGMHVVGVQGTGKSRFIEAPVNQDIRQGRAVIVIDPHGDLADHCLAALPASAIPRTAVLDMAQEDYPFGANPFAQGALTTAVARRQAAERITHLFNTFWPELHTQQYAPLLLSYAIPVMLDNPGTTLLDVRRFLLHREYRAQLLAGVREPAVRDYWQREYDPLKRDTQVARGRPLLNRLHLLTASPLLRNIICQPAGIDFRAAIERREVLFIKLPATTMAKDAAMVGTILMGQIEAAVFSFGDLPEAGRPGVSLYVDEFQNFATPDFEKLFSQGRKFGLRMVVSHQRRDQLSPELQKATLSARTTVVFRVTVDDARKLAQVFPVAPARPKPEDIHLYPCDYLMSHTHLLTDPGVLAFVEDYLLPLQAHRSTRGQVLVADAEFRAEEFFTSLSGLLTGAGLVGTLLAGAPGKPMPVHVPDPTPHLDALLREVMAANNPLLPIPPVVVRGLANSGNFFSAVRNIAADSPVLQAGFTPPPYVVRVDGDGNWEILRVPESPAEWLARCVFFLRLTMAALAGHPLGRVKETTATEIAQKLVRLPQRTAFVRSGDDCGPIRTLDAPAPGEDSARIVGAVTARGRERYSRPREEVEAAFAATVDAAPDEAGAPPGGGVAPAPEPALPPELPDEPALSRWEA